MSKNKVTNAMRMLDKAKIEYEPFYYEYEGDIESDFGMRIAELTGISPEKSFKTLVVKSDKNKIMTVCVPVCRELDLKKLATVCNEKKVEMISVKELLPLTGYIRGGVSPVGMKKKYPTFIDQTCKVSEKTAVSGGLCGVTLLLNTEDLIKVCDATVCDIIKK